ncbi:MAG: hypothetical protein ABIG96_03340 [Candidatus Micrarchaeota archaeon]
MQKRKILVFGNMLVPQDSVPLKILPQLRKEFPQIDFEEVDAVEQIEDCGRELVIIDSVQGIKKVEVITDIESLHLDRIISMHDFDLGITLKLLKKSGRLDSVLIFGVPQRYPKKKALEELKSLMPRYI